MIGTRTSLALLASGCIAAAGWLLVAKIEEAARLRLEIDARDTLIAERDEAIALSEAARKTERDNLKRALRDAEARFLAQRQRTEEARVRAAQRAADIDKLKRTNDDLATALAYRSAEFLRVTCQAYADAGYPTAGACGGGGLPAGDDAALRPGDASD